AAGLVRGVRYTAGVGGAAARLVRRPEFDLFRYKELGAPSARRFAPCGPTPTRLRRAPQTPSASMSALALGLPHLLGGRPPAPPRSAPGMPAAPRGPNPAA